MLQWRLKLFSICSGNNWWILLEQRLKWRNLKNENYLAILDVNSFKNILENGWYVLINSAAGFKDINDFKNSLDN